MRLRVRNTLSIALSAALALGASLAARAQTTATTSTGGTYIAIDPLAHVRYDNRYDISLGMAYKHLHAGPTLFQGANLGGLDLDGSYWLSKRLAIEGTARYVVGTSGAGVNNKNISGPFVSETLFMVGPEYLGPHNKHGAFIGHALFGGTYGKFEQDLRGNDPALVGFYHDQTAPAMALGGHIDLNRSPRWVFRISPDAVYTRYDYKSTTGDVLASPLGGHNNWNFSLAVGMEYKFKSLRRGAKPVKK